MEENVIGLVAIEVGKMFAQPQYKISYVLDSDSESGTNNQKTIVLPPGIPTRGIVINAIITEAYPSDKMQAVQNNYLLDPTDEDAKAEMGKMQQCRKNAKKIADEVMEQIITATTKDE